MVGSGVGGGWLRWHSRGVSATLTVSALSGRHEQETRRIVAWQNAAWPVWILLVGLGSLTSAPASRPTAERSPGVASPCLRKPPPKGTRTQPPRGTCWERREAPAARRPSARRT